MNKPNKNDQKTLLKQLWRVHKLFEQKKFQKAESVVKELLKEFPRDALLHVAHSICFSVRGEYEHALKILEQANETTPDHYNILFHLAEVLYRMKKLQEAERLYRRSIELTPTGRMSELADTYNGLGVLLWHQARREEALEMWRQAIKQDSTHKAARRNLEELTNEYGEPARFGPFDDLWHFHSIMQERYFQSQGRRKFETKEEVEQVMGAIMQAWNDQIAPRSKELDRMSAAEKTELFASVKLDLSKRFRSPLEGAVEPSAAQIAETREERELLEKMDRNLGFLPGPARTLMLLSVPALIAVDISQKRFMEIVDGSPPTDEEEDLLTWAYDLLEMILWANASKGTNEEIGAMHEALEIAREELEEKFASTVIQTMRRLIDEIGKER